MSITFSTNGVYDSGHHISPCLCAQGMSITAWREIESLKDQATEAARSEAKSHANPRCGFCLGSGVERVPHTAAPELNVANTNAMLLLAFLGLPQGECGTVDIPTARRALMRARSLPESAARFQREPKVGYSQPRHEGNVVELPRPNFWDRGLSTSDLHDYVDTLALIIESGLGHGATELSWS